MNHLKLTYDARCKSVRNLVFQPTSNISSHHSDLFPIPSVTPSSPPPRPSSGSENLDSDVEMRETSYENQESTISQPSQSVRANSHDTDGQNIFDGFFDTPSHHPSSAPVIIDSDADSDESDGDGDETQTYHQEPTTPPGRLIQSHKIDDLY